MSEDWHDELFPYVEALPRFNILTLGKAWRGGAEVIRWQDQDGEPVGHASISLGDHTLDLLFGIGKAGYVTAGRGSRQFDVVRRDDGDRGERLAVICPRCKRRVELLLFLDSCWWCRVCHGVKNLTNRLDNDTNLYLRLQDARSYVNGGRPKGVHHRVHAERVAEYRRLKALWGRRGPRYLREEHRFRVNETYGR